MNNYDMHITSSLSAPVRVCLSVCMFHISLCFAFH